MASGVVNIVLRAAGGDKVAGEFCKVGKASTDLVVNVKKVGNVFGELGGHIGGFFQNLLKGGVFGIAQSVIQLGFDMFKKWRDAAKEAAEEAAKAQEAAAERQRKALENLAEVQRKVAAERRAAISDATSQWKKEQDAVQNLAKAMLELERAQARLRGDSAGVEKADAELSALDSVGQRKVLVRNLFDARRRLDAANSEQRGAQSRASAADRAARDATSGRFAASQLKQREAQRDRNLKLRDEARADEEKARQSARAAQRDIKNAKAALEAFDIREQAKLTDEAAKAGEKKAEAEKKAADEAAAAAKKSVDERQKAELAAAQAAARERERLDREAHQKRMADIKAELAEQTRAAAAATGRASAIQSEFDKAFAMYRSPEQAAAVVGEEQAYRNDLERLHKDARRYGGRWRIDELSSLMAAGDTQGVSDTLAGWRKSRGFTPQVEAMVRASAAENAKTTVEDELRKIENNTKDLSSKLEELLSMKGGS